MTVALGTMQLPVTQDADRVRDYLNGTIADGGLWTALGRASDHDHTGGLNGKPISVASIPDGSITAGKLDPSVLLPYSLVDGSKPFTGQVEMQHDAVVRDTLYFGQEGVTTPPDAYWQRAAAGKLRMSGTPPMAWIELRGSTSSGGARLGQPVASTGVWVSANADFTTPNWTRDDASKKAWHLSMVDDLFTLYSAPAGAGNITWNPRLFVTDLGNMGQGVLPEAGWAAGAYVVFRQSVGTAFWSHPAVANASIWSTNIVFDGARKGIAAGAFSEVSQVNGQIALYTSTVDATIGGAVTPLARLTVARTGTVTLGPDAGQPMLVCGTAGNAVIQSTGGGSVMFNSSSAYVMPSTDGTQYSGHPSFRWASIYLAAAPVVGSNLDLKEHIAPLDPAACALAVLATDWVAYDYKPPAFAPPTPAPEDAYDEHDDNDTKAEKKARRDAAEAAAREAYDRMLAETAPGRAQKGYVLNSPDHRVADLFGLPDRMNRSDGADLAVIACALQDALERLAVLEGKVN